MLDEVELAVVFMVSDLEAALRPGGTDPSDGEGGTDNGVEVNADADGDSPTFMVVRTQFGRLSLGVHKNFTEQVWSPLLGLAKLTLFTSGMTAWFWKGSLDSLSCGTCGGTR